MQIYDLNVLFIEFFSLEKLLCTRLKYYNKIQFNCTIKKIDELKIIGYKCFSFIYEFMFGKLLYWKRIFMR